LGDNTDCFLFTFFKGKTIGFEGRIDGLWASFTPLSQQITAQSDVNTAGGASEIDDDIDAADYQEAISAGDSEIDLYDFFNVAQQIFLTAVTR
jgi:hypothetical protein